MEFKEKERTGVSFPFQITVIFFGIIFFMGLVVWRTSQSIIREQFPPILPITPKVYQEFGGFSKKITTGLTISEFVDFNMITNNFTFDGILWFTFDPGAIHIDLLNNFSFAKGNIIEKSKPKIKKIDGQLNVQYRIRVLFNSSLHYRDFPFDDHQIYIILINQSVNPAEIIFESSRQQFQVNADVTTSGWNLTDKSVRTGYFQTILDSEDDRQHISYPGIVFALDYARNNIRYALSIILPLALIFYLIMFSISIRLINAINITAACITAILAYRFVIDNLSPKIGFFMISDYIFFLFLAATIIIFVINIAESRFEIPKTIKKYLLIILNIVLIGCSIYILFG